MKSKRNILRLSMLAIVLLIANACNEDKLNPVKKDQLSDAIVFDDKAKIEANVKGIYAAVKNGQLLGGRYFIYNDVRAENFLSNDGNRVTARAAWEFSETAGDTEVANLWIESYRTINRANLFLEGMDAKGDEVAGTTDAPILRAEARFVRALSYYGLMQFYAAPYTDGNGSKPGVPLRLEGISSPGSNNLAKSSVAEVYSQILADLDFAEANLPATRADAATNTTRAHKNTAVALKTRVYLSMANYAKVIEEANKIVSPAAPFTAAGGTAPGGVAHALQANIATVFTTFTTTESIFSMPFTANDAPGGQNALGFYYRPNGDLGAGGIFYLNPTGILGDATWTAADARRTAFIQVVGGKSWLYKWKGGGQFLDNAPVIRYAEVLLNLSEALARTNAGVDARALALVNAVRKRSDAATTLAPASNTELIDAILKERNIEFLGEGIRSIDILRLGMAFPAKAVPGASIAAVPPTSSAYLWPIPSNELLYNELIEP